MKNPEFKTKKANPQIPGVWDVAPEEVLALESDLQIVDVRGPDEYVGELGHIAGSKLLPLDILPAELDELDSDRPVVFVCRSGARSARASQFAQSQGWDQVFNMQGGMLLWNEKKLPVEGSK